MSDQLAPHMEAVARHLLGEPNKARSTKRELRFGINGSLAVDLAKGTWFDHEAKAGGGVLDLIARKAGIANGSAFDWLEKELGIRLDPEPSPQARQQPRIVATYNYRGELLFQVVRFDPKDFRQRRPDAAAKDGWEWSVKGIELVPYRLPELLKAEEVLVVEGEKDADTLARAGIVATTNPGGAGKWPEAFGRWFEGRHVVIVPDKDEVGRKHAQDVAGKLTGKAASIKVLELPGTAKDAAAWLQAGGTPEQLLELALEAPAWRPHSALDDLVIRSEAELAVMDIKPAKHLVQGLIPIGLTMLSAPPKIGKTWLEMALGRAVASGCLFCGSLQVQQGPFLLLDLEGNDRRAKTRLQIVRGSGMPSPDLHVAHVWPPMGSGGLELLEEAIERHGYVGVGIDIWAKFRPPRPKNADAYQHDYETAKLVHDLAHRRGVAIILIHHNRKAADGDWLNEVSGSAGTHRRVRHHPDHQARARQRRCRAARHGPGHRGSGAGAEVR
jgi:5S rRNA maturation endonuclease (ribonuclease M5)